MATRSVVGNGTIIRRIIFGMASGVIKCRSPAPLPEEQQFSADAVDSVRGSPWKPSTRHPGRKIRMYIDEKDSDGIDSDDADEGIDEHLRDDDDGPEQGRIIKEVAASQRMI